MFRNLFRRSTTARIGAQLDSYSGTCSTVGCDGSPVWGVVSPAGRWSSVCVGCRDELTGFYGWTVRDTR